MKKKDHNELHKILLRYRDTNRPLDPDLKTRPSDN